MEQTVLILGATGRFGTNAAQAFTAAGWNVRTFDRSRDNLATAARGVDVIVNGWNPPYHQWAKLVPGLHDQVRKAALTNDATVIIPGNVYVFGPDAPYCWKSSTRHLAQNPLGKIRIEMEQAYRRDEVRTIIVRSGDYLDTDASGNWFDMIMGKNLAKGKFSYPGRTDIPHAWGYLPDVARAAVMLAEKRDQLARFEDVPFPGYTLTGEELVAAISKVTGRDIKLKKMVWWPMNFARPFMSMLNGIFEMRYLWNLPHRLDGERFSALLPEFRPTPVEDALAKAVAPLLPDDKPSRMQRAAA
ncbi:epimerase [Thalassovita aquimarina]|uniref:epimerase n=1 Tax=Thalassovita aquimarina TaxID=2785917 RepID=UPI003565E93C